MDGGALFIETFFKRDLIARYLPDILKGMLVTVEIAAAVVVTGIVLGLAIALLRSFRLRLINALIVVYVDIARALPAACSSSWSTSACPMSASSCPASPCSRYVLSLVLAAFAEKIWAGLLSVRKGQWEAARSTGLAYGGALLYVILPQAVRLTVPPLTNRTIAITKNTALGTVIGVPEILDRRRRRRAFRQ